MRKIKFVDDGQPSLFDYNFGAASASVSSGALSPAANKAAPCQFNKKMPAFDYIALSRTYGVSNDDLKEAKNKLALQSEWLKSQEYISDVTGELRTFLDFTMSANHSKKYYAEVWNRTNTISDFMLNHNHRIAFLTITLNGCFRRALNGDYSRFKSQDKKKLSPELFDKKLKNEPCSIRDLVDLLNFQWHAFFKRILAYLKGSKYFYIRAFEPHKDGVPHIHALVSYPKEIHDKVLQAYKDIFNAPQNLKSTYLSKEQIKNGEINGFQWSINNPAGYVLKYINKSFVNCQQNEELNHQQAWYIKYKIRRFTTSRHQIPLWIYRKINFFKKDFYNLCLLKDHSDWFCEWDYSSHYFRLSNTKTTELINYENGVLEYSIQGKIIHRYEKKLPKKPPRQKIDLRAYDEKDKKSFGRWEGRKPINRMKDYEFLEYFKALAISNSPHYALCLNELKKRGLNKIFGFDDKPISLNNASDEIDVFDIYYRSLSWI
nr:replication endonuclease [uncultured Campylobacter sp.]